MAQIIEFPVARIRTEVGTSAGSSVPQDCIRLSDEDAYAAPFERIFSQMSDMTLEHDGVRVLPVRHFLHYLREIASFFPEDMVTVSEVVSRSDIDLSTADSGVRIWAIMHFGTEGQNGDLNDEKYVTRVSKLRFIDDLYTRTVSDLLNIDIKHYQQYVDSAIFRGGVSAVVMGTIMDAAFVNYEAFLKGLSDFLVSAEHTFVPVLKVLALKSVVGKRVKCV